jgi:hypothetical protein
MEAFLDVGPPPVYVGFGSMRAPKDAARVAIEAIRAQGRRVLISRGWAGLALIDDRDDCFAVGEVNQQALFGRVAAVTGSRASAVRTPISRAKRSAAGRDHANFAMNRSPTTALDDCHSGSSLPTGSGTVIEHPLSSGATTRSASPSAAAEHSASHIISGTPATS